MPAPFGPPPGLALPEVPGQFAMKSRDCQLAHNATTTPRKIWPTRKKSRSVRSRESRDERLLFLGLHRSLVVVIANLRDGTPRANAGDDGETAEECSSPPHAAVTRDLDELAVRRVIVDASDEVKHRGCIWRKSEVRPGDHFHRAR